MARKQTATVRLHTVIDEGAHPWRGAGRPAALVVALQGVRGGWFLKTSKYARATHVSIKVAYEIHVSIEF